MRNAISVGTMVLAVGYAASAEELDERICQGRGSCALIEIHSAGASAEGVGLTVLEVGFAAEDGPDDGGWGCRFDPDGYEGGREYWLIGSDETPPERLSTICNDGYGAAMVGEDAVFFGDNLMAQERYGGSAWRWIDSATMTLRPRRLLTQYLCSAYGAWTRSVEAIDLARSVSWYAWSPTVTEEETVWCPRIDPTSQQPSLPEPYLLGLKVPGYEISEFMDQGFDIAGLDTCSLALSNDEGPLAPTDPADAPLRLVALMDPDSLSLRLVLSLGPNLAAAAASVRLDTARAEYEALDWLAGERSEPSPYQSHQFSLPVTDVQTSGVWTLHASASGQDGTILFIDHAGATDMLEINLLGLAVSVTADGDSDQPLVSTVPWRDGAPAHTPPIARRPGGLGWPTCRLDASGNLVLDGMATANPLDFF